MDLVERIGVTRLYFGDLPEKASDCLICHLNCLQVGWGATVTPVPCCSCLREALRSPPRPVTHATTREAA